MIAPADRHALETLLGRMRAIQSELDRHDAGICLLHLAAAIASLEERLQRDGESPVADRAISASASGR